jgi:hypothetical protein
MALACRGVGVAWILHAAPFQLSASVYAEEDGPVQSPTAKHEVLVTHETPSKMAATVPTGFGDFEIAHAAPSHISTKVRFMCECVSYEPTPTQLLEEVHETAFNPLLAELGGVGVLSIAQALPSQISASVASASDAPMNSPTAMHILPLHDTPRS